MAGGPHYFSNTVRGRYYIIYIYMSVLETDSEDYKACPRAGWRDLATDWIEAHQGLHLVPQARIWTQPSSRTTDIEMLTQLDMHKSHASLGMFQKYPKTLLHHS